MTNSSKRILVVSDSHGNYTALDRIVKGAGPFDILIHCGDGVTDLIHVNTENKLLWRVPGNVDIHKVPHMERLIEVTLFEKNIIITHGDLFNVKSDLSGLKRLGGERRADYIFYGHTHRAALTEGKVTCFNPGESNRGFYGIVEAGNEEWSFEHKRLKAP